MKSFAVCHLRGMMQMSGEVLLPMKAPQTMTKDLPLLNVGAKHLGLNFYWGFLQTMTCCKPLPISKLDLLVQITFIQSSTVQWLCLQAEVSCLFFLFIGQIRLLGSHPWMETQFMGSFSNCPSQYVWHNQIVDLGGLQLLVVLDDLAQLTKILVH